MFDVEASDSSILFKVIEVGTCKLCWHIFGHNGLNHNAGIIGVIDVDCLSS